MSNELGTWGVVTDPFVPPQLGPRFVLPRCGCVTYGSGVPDNSAGDDGDVYIDSLTEIVYQKQGDTYVQVGSVGGVQVFAGHYAGATPTTPIPGTGVTAAVNYDLDPPYAQWKWDPDTLAWT